MISIDRDNRNRKLERDARIAAVIQMTAVLTGGIAIIGLVVLLMAVTLAMTSSIPVVAIGIFLLGAMFVVGYLFLFLIETNALNYTNWKLYGKFYDRHLEDFRYSLNEREVV